MPITRTAMVDDDGSGMTGTVINNAWKTELYNQIDGVVANAPATDIAFSAANFIGRGGLTWSVTAGQVLLNRYIITNGVLTWWLTIQGPTVSGTGGAGAGLQIGNLPWTFASAAQYQQPDYFFSGSGRSDIWMHPDTVAPNSIVIENTFTGVAIAAGAMHCFFGATFDVV